QKETVIFADRLMGMGFGYACKAGISFGKDDLIIPRAKEKLVAEAQQKVKEYEQQYLDGLITQGEKYNKVVDVWSNCTERVADEMMKVMSEKASGVNINSVYMMAHSGARGSAAQIKQLAGMRGLMAKPSGEIIETPITSNFREGLSVAQYFISTHGARKGLADTALKTANSGYLTRRLVDVTQDLVVTEDDCGTQNGIAMRALVEGGEVVEALRERILGRVLAVDLINPETQDTLYTAGSLVDEEAIDTIDNVGIDEVKVRTPLTCDTRWGVCAKCYGRDLGRGSIVNVGEAIGVIAAQSIGEPGTQLTMRTFHIGGAASRTAVQSQVEAKSAGTVRFSPTMRYVSNAKGDKVVISRSGEITVVDDNNRERERHKVPYGATLQVVDGDTLRAGRIVAAWDPHHRPIVTEYAGTVKFEHVEEGVTVAKQIDDVTGLSTLVVIDHKRRGSATAKGQRPSVRLINDAGEDVRIAGTDHAVNISFPVGAVIAVRDNQSVLVGEVLARIPQETSKTRDITGGLPRVAELFEARAPKDKAILAEYTGTVSFGKDTKGKQRLVITDLDGTQHEELIPKDKHVLVHDGQVVNKGEMIVDGPVDPHDLLRLLGVEALARYIIDEVQDVYRLQGVKINDKHIEVIVRQMLRRVQIEDPGETGFIQGEQVERAELLEENEKAEKEGKKTATFSYMLLGITKASLSTDSFISAASFQETTRVLTEAAIMGKRDGLRGLKENVIVGRLIPAGTGMAYHKIRKDQAAEPPLLEMPAAEEAPAATEATAASGS
ncbi:MAG: DNA-directed RNA polymerase subunit beta', partial [Geminicoccales bacterium]